VNGTKHTIGSREPSGAAAEDGKTGFKKYADEAMVAALHLAERIGKDRSLILRKARKAKVGEIRPFLTDRGTHNAIFVPGWWANEVLQREHEGQANAAMMADKF
jgi:hypothetical protein